MSTHDTKIRHTGPQTVSSAKHSSATGGSSICNPTTATQNMWPQSQEKCSLTALLQLWMCFLKYGTWQPIYTIRKTDYYVHTDACSIILIYRCYKAVHDSKHVALNRQNTTRCTHTHTFSHISYTLGQRFRTKFSFLNLFVCKHSLLLWLKRAVCTMNSTATRIYHTQKKNYKEMSITHTYYNPAMSEHPMSQLWGM
jgi:hypothetical protein